MVSPSVHGKGIGRSMMHYVTELAGDENLTVIQIAASHLSAPFFRKFGARDLGLIPNGWGPGMDRVDMTIEFSH
jgi:GNAT superfamily N-acetyltransferase